MGTTELKKQTVVVSGSFRKYYRAILRTIRNFEESAWTVLSPARSRITNPDQDFVVLESDGNRSHLDIELHHLNAISQANALYVVDPNGYIGSSTALEIGWALQAKVPVFLQSKPSDTIFAELCQICENPEDLNQALAARNPIPTPATPSSSLPELQRYMARVVAQRGFADESARDVMLLLIEEIGELAKAIRKSTGLKVDTADKSHKPVADELADVLIYTLDLANICGVDLIKAFIQKEAANEKRTWASKREPSASKPDHPSPPDQR